MITVRPMCAACIHLIPDPVSGNSSCRAFPEGLPDSVVLDGFDHRNPLEGDHGIRFEQDPARTPFNWEFYALLRASEPDSEE